MNKVIKNSNNTLTKYNSKKSIKEGKLYGGFEIYKSNPNQDNIDHIRSKGASVSKAVNAYFTSKNAPKKHKKKM